MLKLISASTTLLSYEAIRMVSKECSIDGEHAQVVSFLITCSLKACAGHNFFIIFFLTKTILKFTEWVVRSFPVRGLAYTC